MKKYFLLIAAAIVMVAAGNAQLNKMPVKNDHSKLNQHEEVFKKEIKEEYNFL